MVKQTRFPSDRLCRRDLLDYIFYAGRNVYSAEYRAEELIGDGCHITHGNAVVGKFVLDI